MPFLGFGFDSYGPFQSTSNELDLADCITLIIGKNNAGKSCVIDFLCQQFHSDLGRDHAAASATAELHYIIDEELIGASSPSNDFERLVASDSNFKIWEQLIGKRFVVRYSFPNSIIEPVSSYNDSCLCKSEYEEYWKILSSRLLSHFDNYREIVTIRRLFAERDILPEQDSNDLFLSSRGEGASKLVQRIINQSASDESIIEERLLGALNEIMEPDAFFERIQVQLVRHDGVEKWEIYLKEVGKSRVPLSAMGSGLKTVILVLLNLFAFKRNGHSDTVYCFEELENNLHPSLQRRLFEYLYKYSLGEKARFVLTSHSSVAINTFFDRQGTLIYHARKNRYAAKELKRVQTLSGGSALLDDLGVKASDLFQSNGIIWVEGPSDRIYIKAWVEALYPSEFTEGLHYQFLFYGGKLLSHYTVEETAEKINVMFANRNAAIVIDSDRRGEKAVINATKKRVRKEFNQRGLFYWITSGKEIENYLSAACIDRAFGNKAPKNQIEPFELFSEYIMKAYPNFQSRKVDFARLVTGSIMPDDLDVLDLRKKIAELHEVIIGWNS